MIDEQVLQEAHLRILPPGIKPEEYAFLGKKYACKIALLIAEEYNHILRMRELEAKLPNKRLVGFIKKMVGCL